MNLPTVSLSRAAASAAAIALFASAGLAQTLPNGVAAGDTTANSSILWTRSTQVGDVTFQISTDPNFAPGSTTSYVTSVTDPLLPVRVEAAGLNAASQYYYRATDAASTTAGGSFRTPALSGFNGFHMGVSGDWRGELAPYPSVRNVAGANLDLWVSLGDTIYADYSTPDVPAAQASTLDEFRRKHNEVYRSHNGLNTLADIRRSTSTLSMIDDHEVTDNFAGGAHPSSDSRFAGQSGNFINETPLYTTGVQAFHEYNPIRTETYGNTGDARTANKTKLYRERSYGQDAAVFNLDFRSFRDQELAPVTNITDPAAVGGFIAASFNPNRTLMGAPQLNDLKNGLLAAQASGKTWKFVMAPEPIQNLGVLGAEDRYEGYAAERSDLLRFIDTNHIQNVVFISADIHGTLVNNLTYQNAPGGQQIHTGAFEITTGSVAFDAPFGPTVFQLASAAGLLTPQQQAFYNSLPRTGKDAFIANIVNQQITALGYDPLGLEGSEINATLLQGSYYPTHTFGWTDFQVDPVTQLLTVTTYGVDAYTLAQLQADPSLITSLQPEIVSQFVVTPVPVPGAAGLLALAGLVASRRRRS